MTPCRPTMHQFHNTAPSWTIFTSHNSQTSKQRRSKTAPETGTTHMLPYSVISLEPAPLRAAMHALALHMPGLGPQVGQRFHFAKGHANGGAPHAHWRSHCSKAFRRPAASASSCAFLSASASVRPAHERVLRRRGAARSTDAAELFSLRGVVGWRVAAMSPS